MVKRLVGWIRRAWHWKPPWWIAVAAAVAVAALMVILALVAPQLGGSQRATGRNFAKAVESHHRLWQGIALDCVFMAAYAVLGWAGFSLFRDPDARYRHPIAVIGLALVVGGTVADAVEDGFLALALNDVEGNHTPAWLGAMRGAGMVKWALLGTSVVALATLLVTRPGRKRMKHGVPTDRPDLGPPLAKENGHPWDPEKDQKGPRGRRIPAPARIGICLSGGGIRSAAFGLGALQALDEKGKLKGAAYLSAASGGGYLAAGWAVSDAGPPDAVPVGPDDKAVWARNSPEERWFRDHSSYLIPNTKGGVMGIVRLLGGVVVNLLVIWLLLFAAARPVGWIIYKIHPALHAKPPVVLVRDTLGELSVDPNSNNLRPSTFIGEGQVPVTRYRPQLVASKTYGKRNQVCVDEAPYHPKDRDLCFVVAPDEAGVVDVRAGKAEIVTQPTVRVVGDHDGCDSEYCEVARALKVSEQPVLELESEAVADPTSLLKQLKIKHHAVIRSTSGLGGVSYPTFGWWMWELSGGLLAAGSAVALAVMALRLRNRKNEIGRALAGALAAAGSIAFLVVIALPWLTVWIPRTLGHATGAIASIPKAQSPSGSGIKDYLLPGGGFLAIAAASVRQFLAANAGSGTGPSTPWYRRIWGGLKKNETYLRWYETSPTKVVLALVSVVVPVILFVGQLQYAAGNGPTGRLMGFAFVRDFLPYWMWRPEWEKFLLAVGALGLFGVWVDAHAWSLFPYYKYRLSSAFLVRRLSSNRADEIGYHVPLPFAPGVDDWTGLRKRPAPPDTPAGPQLILCCAVNLSEYGVVPPGRRAASFTFSSTEIGGPVVGYTAPEDYWEKLSDARRRDVTIPAAMAISGAAFSPAMGKFNLGPIGPVLALANLRLGVWLPHPSRIKADVSHGRWWWARRRPNWRWFLRELRNKYDFDERYLYVTDGGHWDNLGLVELLRRGCTEIYCISCAGDGADSFGTIGEAIALAREELGVEIELDPSALRAAIKPPASPPVRELRRKDKKDTAAPFAAGHAVGGSVAYPPPTSDETKNGPLGILWYVEADLTKDMPFDVHTFAEAEPIFPDDSTGDQVFNHRQFESYRRLGYQQTQAALDWTP